MRPIRRAPQFLRVDARDSPPDLRRRMSYKTGGLPLPVFSAHNVTSTSSNKKLKMFQKGSRWVGYPITAKRNDQ